MVQALFCRAPMAAGYEDANKDPHDGGRSIDVNDPGVSTHKVEIVPILLMVQKSGQLVDR